MLAIFGALLARGRGGDLTTGQYILMVLFVLLVPVVWYWVKRAMGAAARAGTQKVTRSVQERSASKKNQP